MSWSPQDFQSHPQSPNQLHMKKHQVRNALIDSNTKIYMGLMGKTADYRKLLHAAIMKQPAKPYSIWWVGRDWLPHNFASQS